MVSMKDFNSEMTKLKSVNNLLKEEINNERFDAMDKYYRKREQSIPKLLDI